MKTSITRILFGVVVAAAGLMTIPATKPKPTVLAHAHACTLRSLDATYGFSFAGFFGATTPFTPLAAAGTIAFETDGTLTRNFNVSFGGSVFPVLNDPGTYTLNSDCTFTATFPSAGEVWNLIPVDDGKEIEFFIDTSGRVGAGSLTRQ